MNMSKNIKFARSNRKMRKIVSGHGDVIPASQVRDKMFGADEDGETLTRMVGAYMVSRFAANNAVSVTVALVLDHYGQAGTIQNPSGSSATAVFLRGSVAAPKDVLWHQQFLIDDTDDVAVFFEIDVKGQRKMRKGDEVALYQIGSAVDLSSVLSLTAFIKEP